VSEQRVCQVCGGQPELGYALLLCARCRTVLANRPFPGWIRFIMIMVLAAVALAMFQSPRTLRAGVAFERGQAYESAGSNDAAVREYRVVTDAFPDSTLVLARLAIALRKAGHTDEATAILKRLGGREASHELVNEVNKTVDDITKQLQALSQKIKDKKAAVASLEIQIGALDQQISASEDRLRPLKTQIADIEARAKAGQEVDEQQYHQLVAQHNGIVEHHNAIVATRKSLYAQYAVQLAEVNNLVDQYNQLLGHQPSNP
jgi:hypothetical protein